MKMMGLDKFRFSCRSRMSIFEWRRWSDLHEEIIPSKKIAKMGAALLQSPAHLIKCYLHHPCFSSQEPLQAWNLHPQSSPDDVQSSQPRVSQSPDRLPVILVPSFEPAGVVVFQSLVREWGRRHWREYIWDLNFDMMS